jgi:hypothetical protein
VGCTAEAGAHDSCLRPILPRPTPPVARLFAAGIESFEQLEAAARDPAWRRSAGAGCGLREDSFHAVAHWRDLTAPVSPEDRGEMRQAVLEAAREATGLDGWVATLVGGARRGKVRARATACRRARARPGRRNWPMRLACSPSLTQHTHRPRFAGRRMGMTRIFSSTERAPAASRCTPRSRRRAACP